MLKAETEGVLMGQAERDSPPPTPPRHLGSAGSTPWIRKLVDLHFDFIWRSLRRLGVAEAEVDDAAQKVFWVATRRAVDIVPGSERAFLFSAAMRVAGDCRRTQSRSREVADDDALSEAIEPRADADELVDQKRARQLLDEVLDTMTMDLRSVFILSELEELTAPEIASLLDMPVGTVASRLRRAREEFRAIAKRLHARTLRPSWPPRSGGETGGDES